MSPVRIYVDGECIKTHERMEAEPTSRWRPPTRSTSLATTRSRTGLKRTALMCALVFLGLNGWRPEADLEPLYELVHGVAAGSVDEAAVAVFLRQNSVSR